MKKIYSVSLISLFIIITLGVIFFITSSPDQASVKQTIAEVQSVESTESSNPQLTDRLSPEKQKQLGQITQIYSEKEQAYHDDLTAIVKKYNNSLSQDEVNSLIAISGTLDSQENITSVLKQEFGISLLQIDIDNILETALSLGEEKELEADRLESFQEQNTLDLNGNTQKLVELTVQESLNQSTLLTSRQILLISRHISLKVFEVDSNILSLDTYEQQKQNITDSISVTLDSLTSLTLREKQDVISRIIEDITDLEILLPEQEENDTALLHSENFLYSFLFPEVSADEALTASQVQILILKAEVFIDRVLQESIQTEIEYNARIINQIEYETIIEANLVELEELVILKDSLLNDPNALSLDDIQRFNLGAYVDDSTEIEDLAILSYIKEKTGHIIVYNLQGSAKLGDENMSLYSGYGIETLGDSTVTIIFSDASVLRLEPYSRVNILSPTDSEITVAVETGSIWSRVLKPLLSGDTFTIESQGVSLGVRGTSIALTNTVSGTKVQVVDSYSSDGSASVTLTDTSSAQSDLLPGTQITIDPDSTITNSSLTREEIFIDTPQIAEFVSQDLSYINLLLDDTQRGFYNSPIDSINDSDNFILKLIGELEVTTPTGSEVPYVVQNSELSSQLVNTGSIYHLIKKDALITEIKNNPNTNNPLKISAIRDLDMQNLEDILESKRAIENRFDYKVSQDIISQTISNSSDIEDIFLDFPITDAQLDAGLLAAAKQNLLINSGSSIVTSDITLPLSDGLVNINWETSLVGVVSNLGRVYVQESDTTVILTATLSIGNLSTTKDFGLNVVAGNPSAQDQLDAALDVLTNHINNVSQNKFIANIDLPNFIDQGAITPVITWSGVHVHSNGETNRPSYSDTFPDVYKSTEIVATLSHPDIAGLTASQTYPVGIKGKAQTDQEKADVLLIAAEGILLDHYSVRKDISTSLNLPSDIDPLINIAWDNGAPYIDRSGNITRPSYNIGDKDKDLSAILSHPDTSTTIALRSLKVAVLKEACSGQIIDGDCYELVASAEYNTPGDINLISAAGNSLPKNQQYVTGVNCSTVSPGNCAWTNNAEIENLYGYSASDIASFNKENSWIDYDGEKGILIDNEDADDYLSYDLSSLNLGDDWAIEMSVRGEDLKRDGTGTFVLFNSESKFSIFSWDKKLGIAYSAGGNDTYSTSSSNNNYYKIIYTKDDIILNGNKVLSHDKNYDLSSNINIGASRNNTSQWNGIIDYIKIYNKD